MEVGVLGEVVVYLVVLEIRKEHAQILRQKMEVLSVLDLQDRVATLKHALVINLFNHNYFKSTFSEVGLFIFIVSIRGLGILNRGPLGIAEVTIRAHSI